MMLNRRGIELPVSMIIILIISIIVLGLASSLTYTLVCSAEDKLVSFNVQQEKELERRLMSGAAVIIPDATKSAEQPSRICGGGSVPGAVYALGIRNDNSVETEFTITCEYKGVDAAPPSNPGCTNIQFRDATTISLGERDILALVANVDSSMAVGRHVYTMHVLGGETDKKVSFYLDVE
jgi:hypothetical protein